MPFLNSASGGDGIPAELWCCENVALNMPENLENSAVSFHSNPKENLENSAVTPGLEKISIHSNAKECWHYHTIALIWHASKIMLKTLQVRVQ